MDFLAYALGNDLLNASRPRLVSAISVRRPAVEQIDLRGLILAVERDGFARRSSAKFASTGPKVTRATAADFRT